MPGFATSKRTLDQARRLMAAVGCSAGEIDIRPSCRQMLADIGHPYAEGKAEYDITFENVQAGERTSHLFRLANLHRAIVVGTGDLSELALGWSTYGVGDHMSHYNVNASVPKTLVKHLVRWVAGNGSLSAEASRVLEEIAATEVSPELVPGDASEKPAQSSEDAVGPYELQDFHLYQVLRYGYAPSKVAFLAWTAWQDTLFAGRDQAAPAQLPAALLQDQPVQALLRAERAQGRLGRLALAARRLARAERFGGDRLAGRARDGARRMSLRRRGADGARRALCVGAIAGAALALAGCGGFGPRTVELSQARLQELVARHFPVDKRLLDAIDLTLDSPRVGLQPEANRISVEVALRAQRRRSDPDPTLRIAARQRGPALRAERQHHPPGRRAGGALRHRRPAVELAAPARPRSASRSPAACSRTRCSTPCGPRTWPRSRAGAFVPATCASPPAASRSRSLPVAR